MSVRIGVGLGTRTQLNGPELGPVVDELERLDFDSLWLSERITGDAPDPIVAMSYAAGRTTRLKFGMSVLVLPGRNPVVLAKELATLAVMSGGRLLPAFGLGVADGAEHQAFG
ncbi:MAG: LLM class flavin-dependent oxidoreductase, partial [Ilumatobacteraceae bacterium]